MPPPEPLLTPVLRNPRCCYQQPKQVWFGLRRWLHHRPTARGCPVPNTSHRRCQGWRRCENLQQPPQRPCGPCRGQSLWRKVRCVSVLMPPSPNCPCPSHPQHFNRRCQGWRRCEKSSRNRNGRSARSEVNRVDEGALVSKWFHHRPTALCCPLPNTSGRRCQGWRRCGTSQQTPQRPFGPCRGQSRWMKGRWWQCCFHHRPTVHSYRPPNTSGRRCQGWRRCGTSQQTPQRPFGPCRGQSLWMKVCWRSCCFHHSRCPLLSDPQHFRSPLSRMAQVWNEPADTATAVRPVPRLIAVDEGALVFRADSTVIAQLSFLVIAPTLHVAVVKDGAGVFMCSMTPAMAVRPVPRSIAVDEGALVFRVGSTIAQLSLGCPTPQHFRSPLSRMAQVCAISSIQLVVRISKGRGTRRAAT